MEYVLKRTDQLSEFDKEGICKLFSDVFSKEMSLKRFNRKFEKTVKGFSYHGLMLDDKEIVGAYSSIPYRYRYFGEECIFALSVDTMISEKYRGSPFAVKKMAELVYSALVEDNIHFVFGFPNENIYLYREKVLKWRGIGDLDFYILPVRIGALKEKLRILNPISYLFSSLINKVPKDIDNFKPEDNAGYNIQKINDETFFEHRYDESYKSGSMSGNAFYAYKVEDENGIMTAYIIDVSPLDKALLGSVVRNVFEKEKGEIDAIIYVGNLRSTPVNLYRVPVKYIPKAVRMAGKILKTGMVDQRVFDLNNWNVNLSNFDVR